MTLEVLSKPLKIVIVGAGIGGIACAVECKKKGFDVVMYDQVKVRRSFLHGNGLKARTSAALVILSYCTPLH
jgi:flavin-dependent dehydrogenase